MSLRCFKLAQKPSAAASWDEWAAKTEAKPNSQTKAEKHDV